MKPGDTHARHPLNPSSSTLERRILAGFGSTVLVLIVAAFSFAELSSVAASKRWVRHTIDVIDSLHEVQTTLLDAESGQQGFLITSEPGHLDSYLRAGAHARAKLRRLRELTADNREQQSRLDTLEHDVEDRLAALAASLQLHREREPSVAMESSRTGKRAMERARGVLKDLLDTEERLLREREAEHERNLQSTAVVIGGGSLAAFILGIITNLGIRRGVDEWKQSQQLIEEQALRLEAQTSVLLQNERALAQRLDELRVVNQKLDDQVHGLTEAKVEVERTLADLRLASRALETANRDIEQFAYAASHDLKAPLRGIASLSDWLEEDLGPTISDKSKQMLRLLHGRVLRMEALIDGILAYSRTSRLKEERVVVEVAPLLLEVIELVSAPPGVVTIDVPESMTSIVVQKVPFQQVWMNLLSNALKHGAAAGAAVHLGARDVGEAWEFFVSDNGPGIAWQFHERIFRIFHTLASRDKVEGTGIGLAIVKKLVDDRGGRVWVESEPGKGAKFCFTWPK